MVVFVILHYLVEKETEKCVDSILKLKSPKKVIIVDNCSPNESYEGLKKYYLNNKDVYVIKNNTNGGFADGNNFGYKYAKSVIKDISFMVVMNNDMEINQKNFINLIQKAYDEDKFYVLGPDIYSTFAKIHQNPEAKKTTNLEKY